MSRILYSLGAFGGTVGDIQKALLAAGHNPGNTDGVYGKNTMAAVQAFQQAQKLPNTGTVDVDTWQALMRSEAPSAETRSLELTAAFEGHGYSIAQGNWDGAWLTWGIIGFTLKYGKVQKIILDIQASASQLLTQAFGSNAAQLVSVMQSTPENQRLWADSISVGGKIVEPWLSGFSMLGTFPQVRNAQREKAHDDYFVSCLNTARGLGLKSELGLALCFDIHVQDGGINPVAMTLIKNSLAIKPSAVAEPELRRIVANAVTKSALPQFQQDVFIRKMCIATGEGVVHGTHFVLENWGLDESPAPELA